MFGVSKSGYYSWLHRMEDKDGRLARKREEEKRIMGYFREIIAYYGYVPGKRTFRDALWRLFNKHVSVKRCKKIMIQMNLVPNRPKKDAYKHQASHDHVCAAPANKVCQNFYQGPRKVILTDITYLYYGLNRIPFYLCDFKDAFTKEILGRAMSSRMTVDLVKAAYDRMMEKHGREFKKNTEVFVHSDQGSQFTSTTFEQLLKDDGFIQSVSGRGNSQDNSPQESFFGRLKTHIIDLVALCPNLETAMRLTDGYIDEYNDKHFQYNLAGLTPSEFYTYVTTGIYPLDNYYGVKGTELRTVSELVADRRRLADAKNAKDREMRIKRSEERSRLNKTPLQILARDQKILRREIRKWEESKNQAENQIDHLKNILKKIETSAIHFLENLKQNAREEYEALRIPQNWQKYPELGYIFDMDGLF
jgi:transposase InsO family protein